MSKTYKDQPDKIKFPEAYLTDRVRIEGHFWKFIQLPSTRIKKRKRTDTENHWMSSTPSWWTRLMMRRPERRGLHVLEKKALLASDLSEVDIPNTGRKPHKYYY